ncbi:hypothetical protein HDE70_002574 [Pedobacter cryoconitis]|nr:hypothetical protein [Pedobacter cryoconitis]
MARAWYVYNGTGDPLLISSYILSPRKPPCLNGCKICAIYAYNGGPSPSVLSGNIRNYILSLMLSTIAQPDTPVGAKIYIYGKSC